jgi:hypothetical protein
VTSEKKDTGHCEERKRRGNLVSSRSSISQQAKNIPLRFTLCKMGKEGDLIFLPDFRILMPEAGGVSRYCQPMGSYPLSLRHLFTKFL